MSGGECDEVVVVEICGMHGRLIGGSGNDGRGVGDPSQELGGVGLADVRTQLGIGECPLKLIEQRLRCDQLEVAAGERPEDLGGDSGGGERAGDDDVGIENSPHASESGWARLVLGLERQGGGVAL